METLGSMATATTNGKHSTCGPSNGKHSPVSKRVKIDPKAELAEFDKVFHTLMKDCLDESGVSKDNDIGDAMMHFLKACDYNVPHGKKNRGVSVVTSYKCLIDSPSDDDLFKARVLGWCIEWLQAYFLVSDDIMDHSHTRRGRACWYKRDNIGMMAINDSFYLECAIYRILKKYIRSESYYIDVVELFHETTEQTVIGQGLDLLTAEDGVVDFNRFSMERYDAIVTWKTAYYSFYLPVALAMRMARLEEKELYDNAKEILLEMGHFFQVQDDFLDCYGDPAVTGKVGTDIEDNKCGWLINKALQICTPEQKILLEENYAKNYPDSVARVKEIYGQLNLRQVYYDYEESSYQTLMKKIDNLDSDLPKQMFVAFAEKIFKRSK